MLAAARETSAEVDLALGGAAAPGLVRDLLAELTPQLLRELLREFGLGHEGCRAKQDLIDRLGWQPGPSAEEEQEDSLDQLDLDWVYSTGWPSSIPLPRQMLDVEHAEEALGASQA